MDGHLRRSLRLLGRSPRAVRADRGASVRSRMSMRYPEERARVAAVALQMLQRGFTEGTSGNVSMRVPDGALITPSSVPYPDISPPDVILMDLEGNVLEGERVASVEHKVHLECYKRRPNVGAVVHSHPIVSRAFAPALVNLP